eukprot:scaffold2475_cov115-Isochrysis_galbana.AAC.9
MEPSSHDESRAVPGHIFFSSLGPKPHHDTRVDLGAGWCRPTLPRGSAQRGWKTGDGSRSVADDLSPMCPPGVHYDTLR